MHALLLDDTKCIGCDSCTAACREKHGAPQQHEAESLSLEAPHLTEEKLTVLKKVAGRDGEVYFRRICMHCLQPTCASVCPVGALYKTAAGPVLYDAEICMGCRYCVQACPFFVPRFEWASRKPRVRKCDFCPDLLAAGKRPACAEACPTGATLAGERDALLKEARSRLAAEPDKYVPRIYGEREAGGTSVLMLSSVAFAELGLPENLPAEPLPVLTFQSLSKIPSLVGMASFALAGLWWLTDRKAKVAKAEASESPASETGAQP
jgi:formate dehydrogenase iron-sulfur subunit